MSKPSLGSYGIVGTCKEMQQVYRQIEQISEYKNNRLPNVLIIGETGTGKQLIARAIHNETIKKQGLTGKFIHENCTAIPETLIESILFGYVKGAFTGAEKDNDGLFTLANNGTLFLDEMGDSSRQLQQKLLTSLDYNPQDLREYRPVGRQSTLTSNFRLISASSKNLGELVTKNQFSDALFYRLVTVTIKLPALRDRKQDLKLLIPYFLEKYSPKSLESYNIENAGLEYLMSYDWPGNIRQLETVIQGAITLSESNTITLENLIKSIQYSQPTDFSFQNPSQQSLNRITLQALCPGLPDLIIERNLIKARELVERSIILRALEYNQGNRDKTATQLAIDRTTLFKKMKRLGIKD